MDPNTCMEMILRELALLHKPRGRPVEVRADMREDCGTSLRNLADWIEHGGFAPRIVKNDSGYGWLKEAPTHA